MPGGQMMVQGGPMFAGQARTMARHLAGVPRVHVSESSLVKRAGESLVRHRKQPQARALGRFLPHPQP